MWEAWYYWRFVDLQKPTRSSEICMRNPSVLLMIWCAQTSPFVLFCLILIENPNSHLGSLRLCMRSLKCESYEAIRFLAEGDGGKKKYKKDGVRGCLVCVFKQQFSVFKQYFIHFYILFYPHVFPQMFTNNNFQFLNTCTKRALNPWSSKNAINHLWSKKINQSSQTYTNWKG